MQKETINLNLISKTVQPGKIETNYVIETEKPVFIIDESITSDMITELLIKEIKNYDIR